ncbi:MAG TPA: aminodeoxychorismate synthase component I [Candidatus Omnitrophota bacterium]|nr:aminodeoxychorismate synthase component I [Candidatus Omnitrophota bacterium]
MLTLIQFEGKPRLFRDPERVIDCRRANEIPLALEQMEKELARGRFLAGFLSYEAGYAFEEELKEEKKYDFPMLQFGVYAHPLHDLPLIRGKMPERSKAQGVKNISVNVIFPDYSNRIGVIRSQIAAGNTYQITYCVKYRFTFSGDPFSLYRELLNEQPVPYPAYIRSDDLAILSLSPEMFVRKQGRELTVKPMKGTWPRGKDRWDDLWVKRRLHLDPKNRAENVMIADLLRNDLGKISVPGSVVTPKLFEVARYRTLCQMTSTVRGRICHRTGIYDILKALFPSGSVTGAPKVSAMKLIKNLEGEERRIYTGAIGFITPEKDMFFNVPIRTLLLHPSPSLPYYEGEMGVGGGIVWDSTAEGEWEECRIKAGFLVSR